MNGMKSVALAWILLALVGVGVLIYVLQKDDTRDINSYAECIEAGYPMMKSLPPKCATPDGRVFTDDIENYQSDAGEYENDELGIRFEYPEKYRLERRELGSGRTLLMLIDKSFVPVEGGEGPPTINFDIYESPTESNALAWVKGNQFSNFALSDGKYEESSVSGKPAITYKSDGLYATDNVVVMNRDYVLHISGGYMGADDEIRDHFEDVLESLELY